MITLMEDRRWLRCVRPESFLILLVDLIFPPFVLPEEGLVETVLNNG